MATGIYALITEERLASVLSPLQEFIRMPIRLIDRDGQILQQYGETAPYCMLLQNSLFTHNECSLLHMKAGQHAKQLGEAYIFTCHAELNHIAFPLIHNNELLGTVIAGPFLMEKPDSTIVSGLLERYSLTPQQSIELLDLLSAIRILPPDRVNVLKKIMDQLLSPLLPTERIMMLQTQEKMTQQAHISETIQLYKKQQKSTMRELFYDKETELLTKVRMGDRNSAKSLLNELIAYEIYTNGGITQTVRNHFIELSTLLSRTALESGVSANQIYTLSSEYISRLIAQENPDDLSYLMQDILESCMNIMYSEKDGSNPYIRKALLYIANHYNQPLTIAKVSEIVGLSSNHFSALFQKVVGMKFHEYLCRIRVEESKMLLLTSDYSLTDIAIAAGFPDQSYFCKVFKRIVGLPPGQFRNR